MHFSVLRVKQVGKTEGRVEKRDVSDVYPAVVVALRKQGAGKQPSPRGMEPIVDWIRVGVSYLVMNAARLVIHLNNERHRNSNWVN